MKKTLTLLSLGLVALGPMAWGATTIIDSSVYGIHKSSTGFIYSTYGTEKNSGSFNSTTGLLSSGGADFADHTYNGNNSGNRIEMSVSFQIDMNQITLPQSNSSIFGDNNMGWGVSLTPDGKMMGTWGNNPTGTAFNIPSGLLNITATTSNTGTIIYINGVEVDRYSKLMGSSEAPITGITFNTEFLSAISQIYVHQGALTADQVRQLHNEMQSIPEPSTATLGLLGLGALILRRRRQA